MSRYEIVIGIETHVQLATKTKLFCGCNNDSRQAAPNTNVCHVCLGMPGALPVLNRRAVELSLIAGHALHAYDGVQPFTTAFDRKNYFYPDSPKGYQITQFGAPIIPGGYVEFPLGDTTKRVGVTRAHLEGDAGKLTHPAGADYSLVDLNRAETPLLEIVSEPDMRSAEEAKAYAQELYNLMRFAGVSDADLYYGNMRFDVNVSLRPVGSKEFGTRTESKNLNSFRAVAGVVEYEARRQAELLDAGKQVVQETRGWDDSKGVTFSQRSKEEAHDYRYFPEPDLPPVEVTADMLAGAARELEVRVMPDQLRAAIQKHKLPDREGEVLLQDYAAAAMWLQVEATAPQHARFALNWLVGERVRLSEQRSQSLADSHLDAQQLSAVAQLAEDGSLSSTNAKALLAGLWQRSGNPKEIAEKLGLIQNSDTDSLERIIVEVLESHPEPVAQYRAGELKVAGFLVGQVMKASKGQANPAMVQQILHKKLQS